MRIGNSRLSADTQVCMDGQTAIKQLVKKYFFNYYTWTETKKAVVKLIKELEKRLKHKDLVPIFRNSLYKLAYKQWKTLESLGDLGLFFAVLMLRNGTAKTRKERLDAERRVLTTPGRVFDEVGDQNTWTDKEVDVEQGKVTPKTPAKPPKTPPSRPNVYPQYNPAKDKNENPQKYWDEWHVRDKRPYGTEVQNRVRAYWKRVEETMRRLAKEKAIDESDKDGMVSLRAKAEMLVRHERHNEEIENFIANGVNLVICSSHADCSERCRKWQGHVYSLNGTYGITEDGREYEPLTNATDVYYTTKAGKTYKNGLLGFNCRHRLMAYENGKQPKFYTKEEVDKEREIDEKQRWYEREIIRAREEAIAYKYVDQKRYKKAKERAERLYKEYVEYSHAHGRKYYTSRIRIIL